MTVTPRVYFQRGGHLLVGPLGCFDKGEVIEVPDRGEYVVTGVESDGAVWARRTDAEPPAHPAPSRDLASVLRGLDGNETTAFTMPYQGPQMAAVIRGNRKRHGLPEVQLEVAA